jgi:hypothetical protein
MLGDRKRHSFLLRQNNLHNIDILQIIKPYSIIITQLISFVINYLRKLFTLVIL